jgi:4-amino-4-deoxy-L-arabinose transferase-like glycosyltransferase
VFGQAVTYAEEGHDKALFFAGKVYESGSIWDLSFYPVNYLWRTSLPVLIGLGLAGLAFAFRCKLDFPREVRWTIVTLALFAVLFTAFLSFGGKKFDRYLIPIFAPLDLVAGLGWWVIVRNVFQSEGFREYSRERSKWIPKLAGTAVILGVILAQFAIMYQARASYLSYYNPALGGITKASNVMLIGWGEGLDQAADYLNSKPNADKLSVISWYWQIFSYNFVGKTRQLYFPSNPAELEKADYYVVYVNQWQRDLPSPEFIHFLEGITPDYVVRINGEDYVRVYHRLDRQVPGG